MARKTSEVTAEDVEAVRRSLEALPRVPATYEHESDADEIDEFDALLASLGEDGDTCVVRLYREGKAGKQDEFLRKFSPQEWLATEIDGVQAEFGAGDYRIRIYDGKSKIRKHKRFSIGASTATAVHHFPQTDPKSIAEAVASAMAPALSLMAQSLQMLAQQKPGPSRQEILQEMLQMKQIFGGDAKPSVEPLALLQQVLSISKEITPREGDTSPMDVILESIKQFGPAIADGLNQAKAHAITRPQPQGKPQGQITAPTRGIVPGAAVPAAPPAAAEPVSETNPAEEQAAMRMTFAVRFLADQAERDADPEVYANMVLDNLPDADVQRILAMPIDQLLATLASHDARVTAHAEWFTELRTALAEMLTEEPEPGTNDMPGETANKDTPPTTH